jgi:general stress protein 26
MDKIPFKQELLTFLRSTFIMSIAVSENDKPTSSILLYYVDDELNFYFATHTDSYKTKKLLHNPVLSLSVWKPNEMLIQADGTTEVVTEPTEKLHIVDMLAESAGKGEDFWPPLFRIGGEDYIVFKIKPTWIRKLDLVQNTMTQIDSPFTEITL